LILKGSYGLSFGQVGLITLTFQCTASMLQPLVGIYTDRRPQPYSLTIGLAFTLVGLLLMSRASSYPAILLAAALIGVGSSVFHPEASREAEPTLPPTWNSDCARPYRPRAAVRATRGRC
jgi:MFS transporter, FSR family, fosmidomycin resistance protein